MLYHNKIGGNGDQARGYTKDTGVKNIGVKETYNVYISYS